MNKFFGKELILDIHNCDLPVTRDKLKNYLDELCKLIDMNQEDLHFWDFEGCPEEYDKAQPHLKGISVIQFITTSNITIHTLDVLGKVFINIFSCKNFDTYKAATFSEKFFGGNALNVKIVNRL